MPARWQRRMLACVSGTALGAFSEPDVNSTTAGASGSSARRRLADAARQPAHPQQRPQQFELADARLQLLQEEEVRPLDGDADAVGEGRSR